jgi:hypothetical protein
MEDNLIQIFGVAAGVSLILALYYLVNNNTSSILTQKKKEKKNNNKKKEKKITGAHISTYVYGYVDGTTFPPRVRALERRHVSGWFLLALARKDPFITDPFRLQLVHRFPLSESEMCMFFSALLTHTLSLLHY